MSQGRGEGFTPMAASSKKKRKGRRKKVEVDVKELDGILDQAVEKPLRGC